MDRWSNKVALVTGASAGIGKAISEALVQKGLKVIGVARRIEKMKQLQDKWKNFQGSFHPIQCDLRNEDDILKAFEWAKKNLGGVDILVNNAGMVIGETIIDGSTESYRRITDVNNIAVAICAREAVRSMRERGTPGHIININSICGHNSTLATNPNSFYVPSKFALTAISEIMQTEIKKENLDIKVTNLSPGLVKTEIAGSVNRSHVYNEYPYMEPKDIADSVMYVLSTPPHVLISELTIRPLKTCKMIETKKN